MDTTIKFLSLIIPILIALLQTVVSHSGSSRSRLREEYKLCKEFIEDLTSNKHLHPLMLEKGYLAISGKYLRASEILHLLTFPHPSLALKKYGQSRLFLEYDEIKDQIDFNKILKNKLFRKFVIFVFFLSYILFALMTLTPFQIVGKVPKEISSPAIIIIAFLFAGIFGFLAYLSLDITFRLNMAESIVKEETKRKLSGSFQNVASINSQLPHPKFGSARGLIKMSEDFNEPLDDFEAYNP